MIAVRPIRYTGALCDFAAAVRIHENTAKSGRFKTPYNQNRTLVDFDSYIGTMIESDRSFAVWVWRLLV
jgi:hypothetical protein